MEINKETIGKDVTYTASYECGCEHNIYYNNSGGDALFCKEHTPLLLGERLLFWQQLDKDSSPPPKESNISLEECHNPHGEKAGWIITKNGSKYHARSLDSALETIKGWFEPPTLGKCSHENHLICAICADKEKEYPGCKVNLNQDVCECPLPFTDPKPQYAKIKLGYTRIGTGYADVQDTSAGIAVKVVYASSTERDKSIRESFLLPKYEEDEKENEDLWINSEYSLCKCGNYYPNNNQTRGKCNVCCITQTLKAEPSKQTLLQYITIAYPHWRMRDDTGTLELISEYLEQSK